jgi:hypothetical protein
VNLRTEEEVNLKVCSQMKASWQNKNNYDWEDQ